MYIKLIHIIGMHNVIDKTYNFDKFTYFHGKNGAGKSTILQAIQLGLLGYIPGTDKVKSAIFSHANGNIMSVELVLDGTSTVTIKRTWRKTAKDIKYDCSVDPATFTTDDMLGKISVPIFNFSEFMNNSSNKMKEWFIDFVADESIDININAVLKNDAFYEYTTHKYETDFISDVSEYVNNLSGTVIDKIKCLNEYFKSELSVSKKVLTRLQSTVQGLVYYNDVDDIESEELVQTRLNRNRETVEQLKLQIHDYNKEQEYRRILDDIKPYIHAESCSDDVEYMECISSVETLEKKYNELRLIYVDLRKNADDIKQKIASLNQIVSGNYICQYTKMECNSIKDSYNDSKTKIAMLQSMLSELENNMITTKQKGQQTKKDLDNMRVRAGNIEDVYKQYEDVKSHITSSLNDSIETVIDNCRYLQNCIENDTEKITKIEANKSYENMIGSLNRELEEAECRIKLLKSWCDLTSVNGLQNQIAEKSFENISNKITKRIHELSYFRDTDSAKFDISTKANSFSFGIDRNGSYIPYNQLSSGEKCIYMLAMLMSFTDMCVTNVRVIIVDDFLDHLDSNTFCKMFHVLQKIQDVQIVSAGVILPSAIENSSCLIEIE